MREEPSFISNRRTKLKGAARKGVEYEKNFADYMVDRFGELYVPGPWIRYKEIGKERSRWCQPDGLLFIPALSRIILIETKFRHTSDAWWQLRQLYLPVISHMFQPDKWQYCTLEVTKWYDRDTLFPERIKLCPDVLMLEPGEFGVHIWIPR